MSLCPPPLNIPSPSTSTTAERHRHHRHSISGSPGTSEGLQGSTCAAYKPFLVQNWASLDDYVIDLKPFSASVTPPLRLRHRMLCASIRMRDFKTLKTLNSSRAAGLEHTNSCSIEMLVQSFGPRLSGRFILNGLLISSSLHLCSNEPTSRYFATIVPRESSTQPNLSIDLLSTMGETMPVRAKLRNTENMAVWREVTLIPDD
ncbi:hypothetical protein B0H15DRAFT_801187 [Mycena belliarum]|uniref:Uncharacterized protein n=1 Tax=Mycena belliarum TaxID=1033014 RepID=A0AAD6U7B6_9AGAR|nr:hypothetical protein B0H15DRAFT_801187 [Mycena belliae]